MIPCFMLMTFLVKSTPLSSRDVHSTVMGTGAFGTKADTLTGCLEGLDDLLW